MFCPLDDNEPIARMKNAEISLVKYKKRWIENLVSENQSKFKSIFILMSI